MPEHVLSPWFAIECEHRALGPWPPPDGPRRPLIARFLNFKDRDSILREAGCATNLCWNNNKILIFPDYTREVQARRRSFEQVKQKLRAMQLPYLFLFPARLKVIMADKTFFFDAPVVAWDWLTEEGVRSRMGPSAVGAPAGEGPRPRLVPRRGRRRTRSRRGEKKGANDPLGRDPDSEAGHRPGGTDAGVLDIHSPERTSAKDDLSQSPILG
ncbi:hypothetical protein NDU88_003986 [Pleurodeles waltl]|uniref:Uncharacterized protein n=1 Tax=Pleurodeles waltl TaxID=8319 RepID=A0AAV7REH1_PLEWA|nr:hypothetical protein NDU88_003986 [Pleurodeles waltl]